MSLCEACNKNQANVHVTQISENGTTLLHLCEECASKKGVSLSVDIHAGMLQPHLQTSAPPESDIQCPGCNLKLSEFKAKGWLGCSLCYTAFEEHIDQILMKMHGSNAHAGKLYSAQTVAPLPALSIEVLRQKLSIAIREEDFEHAARLRDVIKTMQFSPAQASSSGDSL
jgi:protein arginine kinase activator